MTKSGISWLLNKQLAHNDGVPFRIEVMLVNGWTAQGDYTLHENEMVLELNTDDKPPMFVSVGHVALITVSA